jgi:hypothetical protein
MISCLSTRLLTCTFVYVVLWGNFGQVSDFFMGKFNHVVNNYLTVLIFLSL